MSQCITLRELCSKSGISRRTIQGYEKAGLVKATGRNKYGHLLYDEEAQKRIATIRLYQQLGFPVKQIEQVLDQSPSVTKKQLEGRIVVLKQEKKEIGELIQKGEQIIHKIESGELK